MFGIPYAISLIGIAKELRPAPSDSQITNKLPRNFTDKIRSAVITRRIDRLRSFVDLFGKFDQAGPLNSQIKRIDRNPVNHTSRPLADHISNYDNKPVNFRVTPRKDESFTMKPQESNYKFRALTEDVEQDTSEEKSITDKVENSKNDQASSLKATQ